MKEQAAWRDSDWRYTLPILITVAFLLQVELAFTKSINWDEFYHFSQIHRHLQDRPLQWLQVPFVWLFWWVPLLPGDNLDHIRLIRLLILPFEVVTVAAIIAAAQRISSRQRALLSGMLYVTGGYVFLHAFALRADMLAASLLTVALSIEICRRIRILEALLIAILVCLAFISTIKSVLYAPAFVGVLLYRLSPPHRWTVVGIGGIAVAAGTLLLWAAPSLPESGLGGILRDIGLLGRASVDRMFVSGPFPQLQWIKGQVVAAPALTVALVATVVSLGARSRPPAERMLQFSLLLPLLTVAFYRNSFPYHFVFILPPAMIAIAPSLDLLLSRIGARMIGIALLILALLLSVSQDRQVLDRQRAVLAGIHEIFRTPVTYIDDCGVVGDFPRAVNHYASGWGLHNYRRRGVPAYSTAVEAEPVPLLLADASPIGTICFDLLHRNVLLPEDEQLLRKQYIWHWGNVFVAGWKFPSGVSEQTFSIVVPGTYTVEGDAVTIDGIPLSPGSLVELERGNHSATGNQLENVALRWGDHLPRPQYPWPDGRIFTIF